MAWSSTVICDLFPNSVICSQIVRQCTCALHAIGLIDMPFTEPPNRNGHRHDTEPPLRPVDLFNTICKNRDGVITKAKLSKAVDVSRPAAHTKLRRQPFSSWPSTSTARVLGQFAAELGVPIRVSQGRVFFCLQRSDLCGCHTMEVL